MRDNNRTTKESAKVIAKTISDIQKVLDAVPVMAGYDFFDAKGFKNKGFDKLVQNICRQNDINEKHIRTVAGWRTIELTK